MSDTVEGHSLRSLQTYSAAADRVAASIRRTSLRNVGEGIWAKCEHEQVTGSFKARGALNKVLGLSREQCERGVVCASAGNHGRGVAYACSLRDIACTVFVPSSAPAVKKRAIEEAGAVLRVVEGGYGQAEAAGLRAARQGGVWVSPYNDTDVIAGQGTMGLELAEQIADAGIRNPLVYVPASGGGLLCGVGLCLRAAGTRATVIGVQTEAAPYLHAWLRELAMDAVREMPTLADGLAGPVDPNSITLELLPEAVDRIELVSEGEIETAMRWLIERYMSVEPSAAVPAAAARREPGARTKVVILSGGNVEPRLIERLSTGDGIG
jgi:threonine dehydratase